MRLPFRLVYSNDYYLPIGAHVFPAQKYRIDRKSTRLNSSHLVISYAVFCLKKKQKSRGLSDPALCLSLRPSAAPADTWVPQSVAGVPIVSCMARCVCVKFQPHCTCMRVPLA